MAKCSATKAWGVGLNSRVLVRIVVLPNLIFRVRMWVKNASRSAARAAHRGADSPAWRMAMTTAW